MDTIFEKVKNFFTGKKALVLCAGIGVGVMGLVVFFFIPQQKIQRYAIQRYADDFFVSFASSGPLDHARSPIMMTFSQPVEAHHVEEFFEIRPRAAGSFRQGGSPLDVAFFPASPYMEGVTYEVTLKSGLYSTLGKKLRDDYVSRFSVGYSDNTLQLVKDGDASYFFGVSDETALTFQVGESQDAARAKIFSVSDPEIFLKSFTGDFYRKQGLPSDFPFDALTLAGEMDGIKTGEPLALPSASGMYLVQIFNDDGAWSWSWVVKSSFGAHFRQDDQGFFLGLEDLSTGVPIDDVIAGVDIYVKREEPARIEKLKTVTVKNLEYVPLEYPETISALIVNIRGETLIVPVQMSGSMAEINVWRNLKHRSQIFVYKDKPLYRSGDVLHFRGLIRQDNDGLYALFPEGKKVMLDFGDKEPVIVTIGKRGEFFGEWKIPKNADPGVRYVQVRIEEKGQEDSYGSFNYEVAEYKKPPFDLTIDGARDEYVKGDMISLALGGYRFDGKPFGNQAVTLRVYALDYYETEKAVYSKAFKLNSWGGMCGGGDGEYYGEEIFADTRITLDSEGKAVFAFDTATLNKKYSQTLTFIIEKKDANGNTITTAKSAIVHLGELNIFIRPPKAATVSGLPPKIFFNAEYQNGQKVSGEFEYSFDAIGYSAKNNGGTAETTELSLKKGTVVTGEDGIGEIPLPGPIDLPDGYERFRITVARRDAKNNFVKSEFVVYDSSEQETVLKIISEKNNLKPGELATLLITAPEDMRVLVAYERGRLYSPSFLKLKKGENRVQFAVLPEYVPSITPTFSFFSHGRYYVEGLSFNVPAMHKLITIDAESDKPQYASGEKATLVIRLTDSQGRPLQGEFSLGIVDKAVYALRKGSIPPMHSSFYYYRSRATNNSSSMTYITTGYGAEMGGGGGGGTSMGLKDSDLLYWDPFIETDENGVALVSFPISGNTIYQAVIFAATDNTELGQKEFDLVVRK